MKTDKTKMTGWWAVAALAAAVLVAGCGGTGAGGDGGAQSAAQAPEEATAAQNIKIALVANSTTLAADGLTPVDLTAIVTDPDTGVAIAGKTVAFAANDPAAAVRLEVTQPVTDASGVATARLHLNGDQTERDVRVLASVEQRTPSQLTIQVSAQATEGGASNNSRGELTVRLGTDNTIEDLADQLSYRKRYVAVITDNAGIPKPNASVLATLRAKRYFVGYWAGSNGGGWAQIRLNPAGQASEDTANFGRCDAGEDVNGDKVLTPGNVASYTVQSQTDANGLAVLNIVYPQSFSMWVELELEVTAQVGGTEGFNSIVIPLPILSEDVTGIPPPPSITRSRGSLSTVQLPFPTGSGDEAALGGAAPSDTTDVPGSPFPYLSVTPTCP